MKTPVLESLFNKVACLRSSTLLKRDSNTGVLLWILRNFQEQLFLKKTFGEYFCMTSLYTKKNNTKNKTTPNVLRLSFQHIWISNEGINDAF